MSTSIVEAMRRANAIIDDLLITRQAPWPEDEWYSLGDDWDLNLWLGPDDTRQAAIYPVLNGSTVTAHAYYVEYV